LERSFPASIARIVDLVSRPFGCDDRTQFSRREALYAEFISEASKLSIDALDHTLEKPERLADAYALQNRIRATSRPR